MKTLNNKFFLTSKSFNYLLFFYFSLLIISQVNVLIESYTNSITLIHDYSISDWLINYQSGFIRRGLIGQILYTLFQTVNIDIVRFLIVFTFLLLILFTFLFIRKWKQHNLSFLLLPSFVLLGGFWNTSHSYLWFRRDILIFLIIWLSFYSYNKILQNKKAYYIPFHLLIIIAILSHEASIFYSLPIVLSHYFFSLWEKNKWKSVLLRLSLFIFPATFALFASIYYKGDATIANSIWKSWQPLFEYLGVDNPSLGGGLEALSWSTSYACSFHLKMNFLYPQKYINIPSAFLWPFIFFSILYLIVNVNKFYHYRNSNRRPFSLLKYIHILTLQYIYMLPMFTILSCDYGRLYLYCIISSFLFYFSVDQSSLSVFFHQNISFRIKRVCTILSTGFFANKYFFFIIFLFAGVPPIGLPLKDVFDSSIIGNLKHFLWSLAHFF